jgi:porin-like protein
MVNPQYYGTTEPTGHPSDDWGWVVGGGIRINTPFISPGDYFVAEVNYTEGALKYLFNGQAFNLNNASGGVMGYGIAADCVFGGTLAGGTATNCHMTTGFGIDAGFEHHWTPQWHQSIAGGYMNVQYDSAANAMLCSAEGGGNGAGAGNASVATAGCNNNWNQWSVGSRLQWDVTKSFYLGVEVMYSKLDSAQSFNGKVPASVGLGAPSLCNTGICNVSDRDNWAFTMRMHKDFLP